MRSFTWPAAFGRSGGLFWVELIGVPVRGEKIMPNVAWQAAHEALGAWLTLQVELGRDIPLPDMTVAHEVEIPAPIDNALLAGLYCAMRERGVSKSELGRMMGVDEKQVRRLLDPHHQSRPSAYAAAFHALGRYPTLTIE